jgi:hypothetical protein
MVATFAKTITEADIVLFAALSGDNNAIRKWPERSQDREATLMRVQGGAQGVSVFTFLFRDAMVCTSRAELRLSAFTFAPALFQ